MESLVIAWCGNVLQLAIIYRAARTGLFRSYPYFYSYIISTMSVVVVWVAYLLRPGSPQTWYWPVQLLTLILGCGVILEILDHVLAPYPGPAWFSKLATILAFVLASLIAVVFSFKKAGWFSSLALEALERNLRSVQALLLFVILLVISYYRIPIGKNMKGMALGYGVYVGTSLFARAFQAYGSALPAAMLQFVQAISFLTALTIWMVALWSYYPNPVPDSRVALQADYELLLSRTRRALHATRSYLGRATR
jgi:hypothetical protein